MEKERIFCGYNKENSTVEVYDAENDFKIVEVIDVIDAEEAEKILTELWEGTTEL